MDLSQLDPELLERLRSLFDYSVELDRRDIDAAAQPLEEAFLKDSIRNIKHDIPVTLREKERAAEVAGRAKSLERRFQAERVRFAYLFEEEKIGELVAAFVKLVDDTFFEYIHLVPWDDLSWLTEETELLPLMVPVIAQVIISSSGKMGASKTQAIVKSLTYLVERSEYPLGDDEEEIQVLIDHVRFEAETVLPLRERFDALKPVALKALKSGSQLPMADLYARVSDLISSRDEDDDESELFIYLMSLLLPLLRRSLIKGIPKPIAFEAYIFISLIRQLKGYHVPNDLWALVVLLFRFLHRSADLGTERSLLLHQHFLGLAETRISAGDADFQKLFVALRLNVFCRGFASALGRCVKCLETIPNPALPQAKPQLCEGCAEVKYCSAECHKLDAKVHERECSKRTLKDQLASEMARELPKEFDAPPLAEIIAVAQSLKRYDDLQWRKLCEESQ